MQTIGESNQQLETFIDMEENYDWNQKNACDCTCS